MIITVKQRFKEGEVIGNVTVLKFLGRGKMAGLDVNNYYKVKCNSCNRIHIVQEQRLRQKAKKFVFVIYLKNIISLMKQ